MKNFRYALWASGFVVLAYWIATTILAFLGCTLFAYNWDKTIHGHCVNLVEYLLMEWNLQCAYRLSHPSPAITDGLAAERPHSTETRIDRYLPAGSVLSPHHRVDDAIPPRHDRH